MVGVARVGDHIEGYCTIHNTTVTGTIITGSSTLFINDIAVARVGDTCLGSCGHTCTIKTGNNNVINEGKAVARLGDETEGNIIGTIVSANLNVRTN